MDMDGKQQPQPAGSVPPPPQWMPLPEVSVAGCPAGLEYLTQIDQLLVHQQVELLEVLTGWETSNRYVIKNSMGQQVYFAAEESDTCHRQCCGSDRGFVMHILDNIGKEVIRVNREFQCWAGCCWCANADCCSMTVTVEAPPGQVVGYVKQAQSCLAPAYRICDASGQTVLTITGPVCLCQAPCCTQDIELPVLSADGTTEVGKISKQWAGLAKEMFTNATNFGITFPMDLDVKMKACMMGAMFLIDFMYFEDNNEDN